jgi:hypothetical protein
LHEAEHQQYRKQPGSRHDSTRGESRLAGANGDGGPVRTATATEPAVGRCQGAGPRDFRHRSQILDDLLVQFGARQDRQDVPCPLRHAVGTPAKARVALTHVARHGQPQVGRQHRAVPPNTLVHTAVTLSISQYLPQFRAPGSLATQPVNGGFGGRERGDFESAEYRLAVLVAQPPGLGDVGAQLYRGVPAVKSRSDEQVVELLPGFWQRGDDLLHPAPQ